MIYRNSLKKTLFNIGCKYFFPICHLSLILYGPVFYFYLDEHTNLFFYGFWLSCHLKRHSYSRVIKMFPWYFIVDFLKIFWILIFWFTCNLFWWGTGLTFFFWDGCTELSNIIYWIIQLFSFSFWNVTFIRYMCVGAISNLLFHWYICVSVPVPIPCYLNFFCRFMCANFW